MLRPGAAALRRPGAVARPGVSRPAARVSPGAAAAGVLASIAVAGRDDERIAEPTFGADGTAPPVVAPDAATGTHPPVSVRRAWTPGPGRPAGRVLRAAGAAPAPARAHRDPAPARARPEPAPVRPGDPPPRPRIEDEPSILGLTRHSNSRLGSRVFALFFALVYAVIVIELVVALVDG